MSTIATALLPHPTGGYEFAPASAAYSGGVRALPGFAVVRATLREPLPYVLGFDRIAHRLAALGRPMQALCGVELRIATPFATNDEFGAFNVGYVAQLRERGLPVAGYGPMARTNVAPLYAAPPEPSLYAFAYTVPDTGATLQTFVLAGQGDIAGDTADTIVRRGERTPDALRAKAAFVMAQLAAGLTRFGVRWADATGVNVYTAHPLDVLLDTLLDPLGTAAIHGLHLFPSRPPIAELAFEADVRGVAREERV